MLDFDFIKKSLGVKPVFFPGNYNSIISGFSIDSRTIQPANCFAALAGEKYDGHQFIPEVYSKGIRCFIVNRSEKKWKKLLSLGGVVFPVHDTVEALAKLAGFYKSRIFASVFAITGSSGKTTSRELIVKMLSKKMNVHTAKKNFNNEIGLPLTILDAPEYTHIIVLEMGMNHKGEIKRLSRIAEPLAGMITNIGYAHVGNLGSLNDVADAKAEIYSGMQKHGFVFLNRDDPYFSYLYQLAPCEVFDFGLSDLQILEDKPLMGYRLYYQGREFDYPLYGEHNLSNLAGALRVGEFYGIDLDSRIQAAEEFNPVSGRSEIIRKDFTIINDCYNANPSSMLAGLQMLSKFPGRRIAVLSDMLELGKKSGSLHQMIGGQIAQSKPLDILLAYGNESRQMVQAAGKSGLDVRWFDSKQKLVEETVRTVQKGDAVLIKASRGMALEEVVNALTGKVEFK